MTYTLYGRAGSGSGSCEALLALSGLDYQVIEVAKIDDQTPDWFLEINPLGQVPVLVLPDGTVLSESAAILIYLADLVPNAGLAPAIDAPHRGAYLRWMVFLSANIYASALRYYYPDRYTTDLSGAAAVSAAADMQINSDWDIFEAALGDTPFLFGDRMSAVDLYAGMLAWWRDDLVGFQAKHPKIARLTHVVSTHPVIKPIWETHGMVV
jgi:glutathione S-transferase